MNPIEESQSFLILESMHLIVAVEVVECKTEI